MEGPFVLNMDPLLAEVWGVRLWYYGLAWALGFSAVLLWVMLRRNYVGLTSRQVWDLSLVSSATVIPHSESRGNSPLFPQGAVSYCRVLGPSFFL